MELCLDKDFFYTDVRVKYRSQLIYNSVIIVRQGFDKFNPS